MSKLTTKARNALSTSQFAGPGRSYPLPDKNHARNALARVAQQVNAGKIAPSTAAKVKAAANRKLGK